jgi:hypothetical protein
MPNLARRQQVGTTSDVPAAALPTADVLSPTASNVTPAPVITTAGVDPSLGNNGSLTVANDGNPQHGNGNGNQSANGNGRGRGNGGPAPQPINPNGGR